MKVQAQHLKQGQVTSGSHETIVGTSIGVRTPPMKIEVILEKDGRRRTALWGKYSTILIDDTHDTK